MTRAQRLAFLKVLAAAAWADGEVQEHERNRIKVLFNGFDLATEHRRELDDLLTQPLTPDDAIRLTKDFASSFASGANRRQLLEEVESMLGADGARDAGERELLDHVRAILASHTPVDGFVDKLRGLFSRTLFEREGEQATATDPADRDEAFLHAVLDDRPERDSDLQRLAAEYSRRATMEERLATLEQMFARAARDGEIDKREAEHIHRVAHLLWISNPEYHSVRDRWRDHIA